MAAPWQCPRLRLNRYLAFYVVLSLPGCFVRGVGSNGGMYRGSEFIPQALGGGAAVAAVATPAPASTGLPTSAADGMAALEDAVAALVASLCRPDGRVESLSGLAAIELEQQLRQHCDRLAALRLGLLASIEASGAWKASASTPSFQNWLAAHDNISRATANREVQIARHLAEHLPTARAATVAGELGFDQARVLACGAPTTETRIAALASPMRDTDGAAPELADVMRATRAHAADPAAPTSEEYLVGVGKEMPFNAFSRAVTRFAEVSDAEATERAYNVAKEKEHLHLSPTLGGWDIRGFLTEEHGQLLNVALGSITSGMFTGAGLAAERRAELARQLTGSQRRAQALADLAQLATDTGMLGGGAVEKRHIVVNVTWDELLKIAGSSSLAPGNIGGICDVAAPTSAAADSKVSGVPANGSNMNSAAARIGNPAAVTPRLLNAPFSPAAFGDGRGPIPTNSLKRLACDSQIHRVVFGPDSQVLDVGRTYRTVPAHIRAAVIARDKHCVYPGCDQPPQRCEVHHAITHWADGGETSAANSALLCWQHHAHVDETDITMRFDGTWHVERAKRDREFAFQ